MEKCRAVLFIFCVFFLGCATVPQETIIGSQAWYERRIADIDQAFVRGELTKEEQLSLKNETDHLRLIYQREADRQMDRQTRWNNAMFNRPLYHCNNGTCTPVTP